MTAPEGAFYSATDADSPDPSGRREEGWFFTWTPQEIEAVLGKDRARIVDAYYAVTPGGNFKGRSILHTPRPLEQVARQLGTSPESVRAVVQEAREVLYGARARRPRPLRDEKILTAWNGLMISAYASAALVLNDPSYRDRAVRAASFVLDNLRRDGRLLRSYKDGKGYYNAYIDDYAALTAALLDLYEATGDHRWLQEAIALDRTLEKHYEDKEQGGFFMTSGDHEALLAREKPNYDGAEPSGNSLHALSLLRFQEFTGDDRYRQRAVKLFRAFAEVLSRRPGALSEMLLALDFSLDTPKEVVIVTAGSRAQADPFLWELRRTFLPNRILVVASQGDLPSQTKLVPLLESKTARKGNPTAYVCESGVCALPTSDPKVFAQQIRKVKPLPAPTSAR